MVLTESNASSTHDRGTLGTLRNASVLLELLSEGPLQVSFTQLAERSGLSPSTAHRLLRSLVLARLVSQDPRTSQYSLGPGVVRLSESYLARQPVLEALRPYLVALRALTEATVLVGLLVDGSVLYADRVDAEHIGGIFRETDRMHDAFTTAAGRVLLGHADRDTWDEAAKLSPLGPGFSDEDREVWGAVPYLVLPRPDLVSAVELAVPVRDRPGRVVAALAALTGAHTDTEALQAERAAVLQRAASAAGRAVGGV